MAESGDSKRIEEAMELFQRAYEHQMRGKLGDGEKMQKRAISPRFRMTWR